ncbi:hypothetical protein OSB04_020403 [Centaurea solstitialis]|uniref:Uncharacterized protein n=1 Tax=Centaurea solstitialis TaxID=347529 RepID=A0AA38SS57_9ASTR|nr:hypothetical protein OSB04_020403 [Centaurea solstitialis]
MINGAFRGTNFDSSSSASPCFHLGHPRPNGLCGCAAGIPAVTPPRYAGEWTVRHANATQLIIQYIENGEAEPSNPRPRGPNKDRGREDGHDKLVADYFSDNPVYNDEDFKRRFRMSRRLFVRIVSDLEREFDCFKQQWDARGVMGFSPLQKCSGKADVTLRWQPMQVVWVVWLWMALVNRLNPKFEKTVNNKSQRWLIDWTRTRTRTRVSKLLHLLKILCKIQTKKKMRRTPCCYTSFAFILKFFNLFQLFVGISIILYSVYMLNQWNKHFPDSSDSDSAVFDTARVSDQPIHLNFGVFGGINFDSSSSASPWFIYAFMGLGVTMCCISCMGHIAADAINGCCLCFYAILKTVFILLEVAFILFIALDRHWEKDLPSDPTGELGRIREFVEGSIDFCKWVGITVVIIQALCLLLAVVLRAMINLQMKDDHNDIENDSDARGTAWEPLLNPRPTQTSVSVSGDGKAFHSDIWSSRMREKYGLSSGNGK